jgi:hypothetical protein
MMIRLREYEENKMKVPLEKLEKDFLDALKAAAIERSRLELADAGARLNRLTKREKDAFREKTFQLKLTSGAELERILEKLEPVKVDQSAIVRLSHSDIKNKKMQLKVKALLEARQKATALVTAVGATLGRPLSIHEWETQAVQPMMVNMKANAIMEDGAAAETTAFKKIKIQAQVNAKFAIE